MKIWRPKVGDKYYCWLGVYDGLGCDPLIEEYTWDDSIADFVLLLKDIRLFKSENKAKRYAIKQMKERGKCIGS